MINMRLNRICMYNKNILWYTYGSLYAQEYFVLEYLKYWNLINDNAVE